MKFKIEIRSICLFIVLRKSECWRKSALLVNFGNNLKCTSFAIFICLLYLYIMLGLTILSKTDTNQIQLNIPDELKGIDLQIIILPAAKSNNDRIEFFTESELKELNTVNLGTLLNDNEDYIKW